jgi:hypothetical protein
VNIAKLPELLRKNQRLARSVIQGGVAFDLHQCLRIWDGPFMLYG